MVLQNRSDYGFSGYQVPAMPHSPKAVKRKRSIRRKVEDNQMCPFDLLVTVAGKLLSEREDSALSPRCINGTSNATNTDEVPVKQEQACKKEPSFDQQSCDDASVLGPEIVIKKQISCGLKEHSQVLRPKDSVVKSEISDAIAGESKILNNGVEISSGRNPPAFAKVQGDGLESEHQMPENGLELNALNTYSSGDPIDLDVKPPALVSSDSSIEIPVCRNNLSRSSSLPKHESAMELVVDSDDDDNSSGCTHPSTITHKTCRPQLVGDRGVRKLSALKYWKAAPNMFKYGGVSHYDTETKLGLHGKKTCYTRHRTQRRSFFKIRKLFERCSVSASNGGFLGEDISNLWEKGGINIEVCDPHKTCLEANSAPTSKSGQNSSYDSGDFRSFGLVKLSIKSFKVPELFIEIPETATVGSLKRTVMEAVTAILEGGLRVGVLFQGKKVRDDNKTLRQAGISQCAKLDNLGFTLDPSPTKTPPPHFLCLGDAVVVEPPLAARIPPGLALSDVSPQPQPQPVLASSGPQSDHDSVHSPTDDVSSLDQTTTTTTRAANRLALVALPPMSVPLRKPRRRPEHVQRRIRRPFSVAEVEALVQAVEKLGTGRWRDVKLGAFGNAKHRTYVDLKDKWKTLVHTARISPRQRRGEAVPQELLDRVLSAQAYRSQQQAKLHLKPAHLMIHHNTRVEKDDC